MAKKKPQPQEDAKALTPRMKDLPKEMMPRERLLKFGGEVLEDYELLAILLRTGIPGCNVMELAKRLVDHFGGIQKMAQYPTKELYAHIRTVPELLGIGESKLISILTAIEIGARIYAPTPKQLKKALTEPEDVARLMFSQSTRLAREAFWAILLDRRLAPIRDYPEPVEITRGIGSNTIISPHVLFRPAVMFDAQAIILVHNHPSGNVEPSTEDIVTTQVLIEAGRQLRIPLFDHVIVGRPDVSPFCYSLRKHERCVF